MLTKAERIDMIKSLMRIGGSDQDGVIEILIDEAIEFLISSGVKSDVAQSKRAIGAIAMYVYDTDNYSPGSVKYSDALIKRTIQLCSEV